MKNAMASVVALLGLLLAMSCQSAAQKDRQAAVAGSFYPADPAQLTTLVERNLAQVPEQKLDGALIGIVAPHAGYQYSAGVAAYAFALLKGKRYKRVVLIGPSHVEAFGYSSVFDGDAYSTPLGKVAVDKEFAKKVAEGARTIKLSSMGHAVGDQVEHALEVELPFLQRTLGDFKLVPIVMGDQSYRASRELATALAKLLRNDSDTLLVASSDLSHYHTYDEAVAKDRSVLAGVTQNDFLTVSRNLEANKWEACGGAPIVTVMMTSQHLGGAAPRLLKYANSGDVTGDKRRVVGYSAIAFVKGGANSGTEPLGLSDAEKAELLAIAKQSVETAVREHKKFAPTVPTDEKLRLPRGAFVTLTKRGELRGCIGYVVPDYRLFEAVRDVAALAAQRDPRFPQVRPEELKDLEYEISVLSPFQHVLDVKNIRVGEHGLLIRREGREGILLPQVPVEEHWDRMAFLQGVSQKAGLLPDAWQDDKSDLFTFTATVFSDHDKTAKATHP